MQISNSIQQPAGMAVPNWVLVHFTAASSVCVHFLLIQYSVPLLSQLQFPINRMVWNMHNNT